MKYTADDFKDAATEIGAGMVLFPRTEAECAHNGACERAIAIVTAYRNGEGLFQLTRVARAEEEGKRNGNV